MKKEKEEKKEAGEVSSPVEKKGTLLESLLGWRDNVVAMVFDDRLTRQQLNKEFIEGATYGDMFAMLLHRNKLLIESIEARNGTDEMAIRTAWGYLEAIKDVVQLLESGSSELTRY